MSSYFSFEGTALVTRKFKIEVIADNYEEAEETALDALTDMDNIEKYSTNDPEFDIEIDTYEEVPVPQFY